LIDERSVPLAPSDAVVIKARAVPSVPDRKLSSDFVANELIFIVFLILLTDGR